MHSIKKPAEGEYKRSTLTYINEVPDEVGVLNQLSENLNEIKELIQPLNPDQLNYRYDDGKWNLKEMLVHLMDSERIFTTRALHIARNNKSNLPGFSQDDYVIYSAANERSSSDILETYEAGRNATLLLFNHFTAEQLQRIGTADGHPVSVRALVYMTTGHEMHHINIMKERYLSHFNNQ